MFCPHCDKETPDESYRCSYCGKVVTENRPHAQFKFKVAKKSPFSSTNIILILALVGLAVTIYFIMGGSKPGSEAVNAYLPGEELVIEQYIQKRKFNIVLFYSEYNNYSKKISSMLKKLEKKRPDIVTIKVDINRKEIKEVDLASPLARQFNIEQLPFFLVYNQEGNMIQEGRAAADMVFQLLKKEGVE